MITDVMPLYKKIFLEQIIGSYNMNRCMGTCNKSTCSERVCTDPLILGHLQLPVSAGHLQQPPAAATCSNINHLQGLLAAQKSLRKIHKTYSNHLQRALSAVSTTCSNALEFYGTVP